MIPKWKILKFALSTAFLLVRCQHPVETNAAGTSIECLCVHATAAMSGPVTISIAPSAVRVDIDDTKCYLVSKAPAWQVVFINSETGKAMDMGLSDWIKHYPHWGFISPDDWPRKEQILLKHKADRFAMPCEWYVFAEPIGGKLVEKRQGSALGEYLVAKRSGQTGHIGSSSIIPKETCQILQRLLNAPEVDGLPLMIITSKTKVGINGGRDDEHYLTTRSVDRKNQPVGVFAYPAKFQRVRREAEVLQHSDPGELLRQVY